MQFNTIGGRVDVKYTDYGLAARFEMRHSYCCMAVMLHQYLSELPACIESQPRACIAKPLNRKIIDALLEDVAPLTTIHNFLKVCLQTYKWNKDERAREKFSECVVAETRLFSDCGKILMVLGGILAAASTEKKIHSSQAIVLSPEDRRDALESKGFKMEKQLYLAEKKYRKGLRDAGIYNEETKALPTPLVPDPEPAKDKDQKKQREPAEKLELLALPASALPVSKGDKKDDGDGDVPAPSQADEAAALSEFFKRLNISGCFQHALLRPDAKIIEVHPLTTSGRPAKRLRIWSKAGPSVPVKQEQSFTAELEHALTAEINQALSQCNEVAVQEVLLPHVLVQILGMSSDPKLCAEITVDADDLLPKPGTKKEEAITELAQMKETDAVETIETYPTERHEFSMMESLCQFGTNAIFLMANAKCTSQIKILEMNTDKPYSFQARTKKAFKKNELMLFPFGKLIPKAAHVNVFEDSQAIAKAKYSSKQINPRHIFTVPVTAAMSMKPTSGISKLKKKARRGAGKGAGSQPDQTASAEQAPEQAPRLDMVMPSPASMLSYSPQHDVVSPFWAVCRQTRAASELSNMELRTVTMKIPFPAEPSELAKFPGFSEKVYLPEFTVTIVAMSNTKALDEGEVLTLPFFSKYSSLVE